jgi:hypothetical protein
VTLTGAAANAPTWLVVGLSELSLPFFGGTLVPSPGVSFDNLTTDGSGSLQFPFSWPTAGFAGVGFIWQAWILDAAGPAYLAASNALSCIGG